MTKELEVNITLSHYRIVSKIGAGGMGEVFLAEDTKLDRQVALKILPLEFAEDSERMSRFVREAKSASALNHPNIITIYEIGETHSAHFIATEYIQGETLHARLKENPPDLKTSLDIAIQIVSALDAAHRAGIVHRDIKPENVMIRPDGLVKLLDFGIAKLSEKKVEPADAEAATALKPQGTSPGMIIGTANYMSPEQARGKVVDARSDLFSCGIVLYEMLSGRRAFVGENALDVIGAILHKEPTPLSLSAPGLPHEVERIVNKTLRKDAGERYQTARDLLTDLKDARQELEFQDKLERTAAPNREEPRTQTISTPPTDAPRPPTSSAEFITQEVRKHKLGVALGSLVLLILVGAGVWSFFLRAPARQLESIAVMPFVNESGNADVEYLSDGMTESLINSLSQIPNLSVKARSSVFRYKGKEIDPKRIASELNVQAILTGRIIQRGEQLTLSLELIDGQTENVIWSESYNRKQTDLVSLQSEIARDVSSKLKLKLSGAEVAKVEKNYTANPEAYQLYLRGKFFWNKRTGESIKQAVEFYKQAIDKDPNYAQAYAGLASSYIYFPTYTIALPKDSMPQAKAAATRALELDDSLAEAYVVLGRYRTNFEWDRDGGEQELRRAIELDPNFAWAHTTLGAMLAKQKRFDEAIAEAKRAEEIDPLALSIAGGVAERFIEARRFDESITQSKKLLPLDPNYPNTHWNLGWAYLGKGLYQESITSFQKYCELSDDPLARGYMALAHAKLGHRDEAAKLLDWLKQESSKRYVPSFAFALTYIALGQKDEAFVWLEKDVTDRTGFASSYAVEPALDDVRDDPRFKDLLKRMNLPE